MKTLDDDEEENVTATPKPAIATTLASNASHSNEKTLPRDDAGQGSNVCDYVDLAGSLSRLALALTRVATMHEAIRQRTRSVIAKRSSVRARVRVREDALVAAAARYEAGATLRDLAAQLGVSRPYPASLLRARGVRVRRRSPSEEEVAEMKRLYASGESLERVGTRLGFSAGTVRTWLLNADMMMRDQHGRER